MTTELTTYIANNPRFDAKDARKITQLNVANLKTGSALLEFLTKLIGFGWIVLADSPRGGAKLCAIPRQTVTKEFDGDSNKVRYWLASQGFACSAKQFYMTKQNLEARGVTFSDDGTFAECEPVAKQATASSAKTTDITSLMGDMATEVAVPTPAPTAPQPAPSSTVDVAAVVAAVLAQLKG